MNIDLGATTEKKEIFEAISEYLLENKLTIHNHDDTRPWGGFFVIEEAAAAHFIQLYFPHLSVSDLSISGKLSPKILVVAPGKKLSWQYHHRRAEIWKVIGGEVAVITSDDDTEKEQTTLQEQEIIQLKQGERHRLVGLENWAVLAEIWRHTDAENPSDEDDIIRVQDDFGR